jgi:hypothetical protein
MDSLALLKQRYFALYYIILTYTLRLTTGWKKKLLLIVTFRIGVAFWDIFIRAIQRGNICTETRRNYLAADAGGRAVKGLGLGPHDFWDCRFETRRGNKCLSFVNLVCCELEISATGQSLIQRSPTECVVSVWSLKLNNKATGAVAPQERILAACFGSSLNHHEANVNVIGQMNTIRSLFFQTRLFFKYNFFTSVTMCADQLAYF